MKILLDMNLSPEGISGSKVSRGQIFIIDNSVKMKDLTPYPPPLAKTAHHKTVIQRQIDATDRQIDQLVYELYGLADEEIKIVEEG